MDMDMVMDMSLSSSSLYVNHISIHFLKSGIMQNMLSNDKIGSLEFTEIEINLYTLTYFLM